jgi:hypothetical protein
MGAKKRFPMTSEHQAFEVSEQVDASDAEAHAVDHRSQEPGESRAEPGRK